MNIYFDFEVPNLIYIFTKQRLQKLIYLHLLTSCFMKISLQSSELNVIYLRGLKRNLHETACKQMQIN